jgi:hypothetical protein
LKDLTIYISGPNCPGEGEIKIVDWVKHIMPNQMESVNLISNMTLRDQKRKPSTLNDSSQSIPANMVIVSPDSDAFLQAFCCLNDVQFISILQKIRSTKKAPIPKQLPPSTTVNQSSWKARHNSTLPSKMITFPAVMGIVNIIVSRLYEIIYQNVAVVIDEGIDMNETSTVTDDIEDADMDIDDDITLNESDTIVSRMREQFLRSNQTKFKSLESFLIDMTLGTSSRHSCVRYLLIVSLSPCQCHISSSFEVIAS